MSKPVLLAPHEPPELYVTGMKSSVLWDENEFVSSTKMNGNRCLCVSGSLYTRAMKAPQNLEIADVMEPLQQLAAEWEWVIDMELCDRESASHSAFAGVLDSFHLPIPETMKAYVFDAMPEDDWHSECAELPYEDRILNVKRFVEHLGSERFVALEQRPVRGPGDVLEYFAQDIASGDEGSILRSTKIRTAPLSRTKLLGGWYKHGRATPLQQILWKVKNNQTVDGQILCAIQRRKMRPDLEREIDSFGHVKRTHRQADYELEESVGSFLVAVPLSQLRSDLDPDGKFHVETEVVFGKGFSLDKRAEMWQRYQSSPESFIGRWVELLHTPHGSKAIENGGTLKGAKLIRFRRDKDAEEGIALRTTEFGR